MSPHRHGRKSRRLEEGISDRSASDTRRQGHRTPSPSAYREALASVQPQYLQTINTHHPQRHRANQQNHQNHSKNSRSSSLNRSYHSSSSSTYSSTGERRYNWDGDADEYYRPRGYDDDEYRYDLYDDEIEEEEEEPLPISRLRGPKLKVQIIPFPGREAEAEEAARRARREYSEEYGYGDEEEPEDYLDAQGDDDGEMTPVQGLVRPSMAPRPSTTTVETAKPDAESSEDIDPANVEVTPLSQEDYDSVSTLFLVLFFLGVTLRVTSPRIH